MGPIATKWDIYSWPTTYLIDAKGIIRYKNIRGEELDEAIEELMAEAGHEVELETKADKADDEEEEG